MDALRTPDDRFADLPGLPVRAALRGDPRRRGRHAPRPPRRRGRPVGARGAAAPRRAELELPLPPHDPRARRRGPPRRGARPRRLRPLRQAGQAHRLHLRPPRRLAAARTCSTRSTCATSRSCARTGAACSGCGWSPPSPIASPAVVAANTFLPTGDGKPGDAFLAWQKFSQEVPEMPIGRIVNGGCTTDLGEDVIAAYDAPFPDETYKEGARQFPTLVPTSPEDPEAPANRAAWEVLAAFDRPFLCAFSDEDQHHRRQRAAPHQPDRRRRGPAPHDHHRRRPLPPGGPRPAARAGRRSTSSPAAELAAG